MDDSQIALILLQMGISPSDPNYATYVAGIRNGWAAQNQTQGRWFEEDTRRYNATLQSQKQQIENQYKVAMAGVRNEQERIKLDRWKAEQDTRLREAELEISRGNLEVAREKLGIERGAQGLDLLRTSVDLNSQVRNWAKALDWRRGVRENPDAPVFLRSLIDKAGVGAGSHAPSMIAPQGLPEQNSLAAVLAGFGMNGGGNAATDQLAYAHGGGGGNVPVNATTDRVYTTQGGQTAATGATKDVDPRVAAINAVAKNYTPSDLDDDYDEKDFAALRTIAAIARQGTGKSANKIAQLTTDERDYLAGGLDRLGIGADGWLADAERKRYGGGGASGRAA